MNLHEKEQRLLFQTYKRLSLDVERGEGPYLFTKDGTRYLDMFAGLAVNALGYNHPSVRKTIQEQLERYIHLSNYFYQDSQIELAELLLSVTGYSKVFFSNSGTEAMEGALKLSRKWGQQFGKKDVFGLSNSFHGRTFGSLSITDRDKYREGFGPFLPNTGFLQFNNIADLEKNVNAGTLAVVVEFIQGEGGINLVSQEYAQALRELSRKYGFLIIADEIQSGIGRTGKFFAFQHYSVEPDIVVLAKALGGGLPLGAFMASEKLADVLKPGMHGTTFGGNPVSCAAGLATLREIISEGLVERAYEVGAHLLLRLNQLKAQLRNHIADVRGRGLMVGLDLTFDGTEVVEKILNRRVLLNLTNTTVIRWLPPLIITKEHVDEAMVAVESALRECVFPNQKADYAQELKP
jgi:acetylornithine/N-succinyldiaminopimelate aminotransferase